MKTEVPVGCETLDAVTIHLPGGAYTTFCNYDHNKIIRKDDHRRRLEEMARLAHKPVTLERLRLSRVGFPMNDEYLGK